MSSTPPTWCSAGSPLLQPLCCAASTSRHSPNVDGGDFVIVINADKVAIGGDKLNNKKAYRHSGYPGGLSSHHRRADAEYPDRVVEKAIVGMLPHNKAEPSDPEEAEGVRGIGASAHRSAADPLRDQAGGAVTDEVENEINETEVADVTAGPRSTTPFRSPSSKPRRQPVIIDRPIQTVGRRKEAVVRVRLMPAAASSTSTAAPLEDYFPTRCTSSSSRLRW